MNYQETLRYLFAQLPMFQRVGSAAYKADLGNTLRLDSYFNHPHTRFKSVHIAGTNGKGSTSHMLASILQSAGYTVGLYTSPHLRDFRERIRVNGQMIPESEVVGFVAKHGGLFEQVKPSFFEMTVALAFDYFARQGVEVAVVEVGLGGRLDSTNIITPLLSVITNIGLDHTDLLGCTLPAIAAEKAGIIKPGVPVVIGQHQPEVFQVFADSALANGSELVLAEQRYKVQGVNFSDTHQLITVNGHGAASTWSLDLMGSYQRLNLPGVLASVDVLNGLGLKIPADSVARGLGSVRQATGLMGRWQTLRESPRVLCDTGHNVDGIRQVLEQIGRTPHGNLHMVIGMVGDKNIDGMLALLPQNATYYFTRASIPRALNQAELQQRASGFGLAGGCYATVGEALRCAIDRAAPDDLVFVGGSTFVVAEVV